MEQLFTKVLNMSVTGSYIILAVLAVRLLLRGAPKKYAYMLWSVAAFRLVCPFSFSSIISIFNLKPFDMTIAQSESSAALTYIPSNAGADMAERITTGIPIMNSVIRESLPQAAPHASADPAQIWLGIGTAVWCIGAAVLLLFAVVVFIRLRGRLATAVLLKNNVYESDQTGSPFVLGLFKPKIYIPFGLKEHERSYILRHETFHIQRKDHIVKLLAFVILTVHWFNPLVWLAFMLMSRDMEMSCDERVLLERGNAIAADYGTSLLSFASNRKFLAVSPLAFGETGVKGRIRNVLKFKKPGERVTAAAIILCLAATAACAANPLTARSTMQFIRLTDREKAIAGISGESALFDLTFTDSIKGMKLYAEEWRNGEQISSQCIVSGDAKDQLLYLSSDILTDADFKWTGLTWEISVSEEEGSRFGIDLTHSLPEGMIAEGCATSVYGAVSGKPVTVEPGNEYILVARVFSPPGGLSSGIDCEEFSENSETLSEYPYVSLIRCRFSSDEPKLSDASALYGSYIFEEQLYMNPLSSFIALGDFKEYYTFSEDALTITSFDGRQEVIPVAYERVPVDEEEFNESFMFQPAPIDISKFNERVQVNLNESDTTRQRCRLYFMDDEIWFARVPHFPKDEAAPMFWSIYRISRYDGELPAPPPVTAGPLDPSEVPLVSIKGSQDGVEDFLALQGGYESGYENDACFNITPESIREASDYAVFKYAASCASFLLYEDTVYPLGEWFGGFGVTSMELFDNNGDGLDELFYTYSWGSGMHRSHAAYFDPAAKKSTAIDYAYFDGDMILGKGIDGLSLYSAKIESMESFTDFTMSANRLLGSIVFENGQVSLSADSGQP